MKRMLLILTCLVFAVSAQAGVIQDIQNGLIPANSMVTFPAIVTASAYQGVCVAEAPFGAYCSIWVYLGPGHGLVAGDVVDVYGEYYEYNGLSEVDCTGTGSTCTVTGTDTPPAPVVMTAAAVMADPEPWASVVITISDALEVTELLSYNEWMTTSLTDGTEIWFDDEYFYPAHPWVVGDCFSNATGFWTYSFGAYKLAGFVDGLPPCGPVAAEDLTFGTVKALYR